MGTLWLLDYSTAALVSSIKAHNDRITGLTIVNDMVVSCSKESFINVYVCNRGFT